MGGVRLLRLEYETRNDNGLQGLALQAEEEGDQSPLGGKDMGLMNQTPTRRLLEGDEQ